MEKYDIHKNLGYLTYSITQKMKKNVEKKIRKYDITSLQFSILLQISTFKTMSQKDISNVLSGDNPSTAKIIKKLLDKNLVSRISSKEDKRVKLISLSPQGQELLDKLSLETKEEEEKIKSSMEEVEFNMLIHLLKKADNSYKLI